MRELYLLAAVRAKEVEQRRQKQPPRSGEIPVSRSRVVLARVLMAAAERLWPEASRTVLGEAR